jgi:signal transduction histidine kinase
VPLITQGELIGALTLGFSASDPGSILDEDDEEIAVQVAAVLALAIQQASLHEQVKVTSERLRQLAQQVVTAQEEERRRLSRELHDESGQALTALKIGLDLIRLDLPEEATALQERIGEAVTLSETTMDQIRMLAQDLRPPALDAVGLYPTLEGFCQEFGERTQLNVRFSGAEVPPLSDAVNISLYRVLQEALTNAAKHASADQVEVTLDYDEGTVYISVEDDGVGFDVQNATADPDRPGGIGLLGMQERLDLLGGELIIDSRPGRGTRIVAQIPWEEAS